MTTTMQMGARRSASARFPWRSALFAATIAALSFAIPAAPTDAEELPQPMLARAHQQLQQLMSSRDVGAAETRTGLLAMRASLRPLATRLHHAHPALASSLESELDDALAQVDGDGALLSADRAEFEVYYLVPIAQTLTDVDDALRSGGR